MNIGKLDKRIQIIKLISGGVDAEGYDTDAVEELVWECWAQVSQTSGTELIKADAELSDEKKRFLIRYTPIPLNTDMMPGMTTTYNSSIPMGITMNIPRCGLRKRSWCKWRDFRLTACRNS